jgi:hypothetical protein
VPRSASGGGTLRTRLRYVVFPEALYYCLPPRLLPTYLWLLHAKLQRVAAVLHAAQLLYMCETCKSKDTFTTKIAQNRYHVRSVRTTTPFRCDEPLHEPRSSDPSSASPSSP